MNCSSTHPAAGLLLNFSFSLQHTGKSHKLRSRLFTHLKRAFKHKQERRVAVAVITLPRVRTLASLLLCRACPTSTSLHPNSAFNFCKHQHQHVSLRLQDSPASCSSSTPAFLVSRVCMLSAQVVAGATSGSSDAGQPSHLPGNPPHLTAGGTACVSVSEALSGPKPPSPEPTSRSWYQSLVATVQVVIHASRDTARRVVSAAQGHLFSWYSAGASTAADNLLRLHAAQEQTMAALAILPESAGSAARRCYASCTHALQSCKGALQAAFEGSIKCVVSTGRRWWYAAANWFGQISPFLAETSVSWGGAAVKMYSNTVAKAQQSWKAVASKALALLFWTKATAVAAPFSTGTALYFCFRTFLHVFWWTAASSSSAGSTACTLATASAAASYSTLSALHAGVERLCPGLAVMGPVTLFCTAALVWMAFHIMQTLQAAAATCVIPAVVAALWKASGCWNAALKAAEADAASSTANSSPDAATPPVASARQVGVIYTPDQHLFAGCCL